MLLIVVILLRGLTYYLRGSEGPLFYFRLQRLWGPLRLPAYRRQERGLRVDLCPAPPHNIVPPRRKLLWRIRTDSSGAQPRALECRIDLERNNADAIVLAMTSSTPLLPLRTQRSRAPGDPPEASLSQICGRASPLIYCRLAKPAPNQKEESSKSPGPNFTPGRSPLPALAWRKAPSAATTFANSTPDILWMSSG